MRPKKILRNKAQKLAKGVAAPIIPGNGNAITYFLLQKKVDVFLVTAAPTTPMPGLDPAWSAWRYRRHSRYPLITA